MIKRAEVLSAISDLSGESIPELEERFQDMKSSEIIDDLNEESRQDLIDYLN